VDLADLVAADPPAAIHQVERGPVLVAERAPVAVVRIDEVRKVEAQLARVRGDRVPGALVVELGRVDPERRQPSPGVA